MLSFLGHSLDVNIGLVHLHNTERTLGPRIRCGGYKRVEVRAALNCINAIGQVHLDNTHSTIKQNRDDTWRHTLYKKLDLY